MTVVENGWNGGEGGDESGQTSGEAVVLLWTGEDDNLVSAVTIDRSGWVREMGLGHYWDNPPRTPEALLLSPVSL